MKSKGVSEFDSNHLSILDLTVTILDNEAPLLTISNGPSVVESDVSGSPAHAIFTISSPVQPATNNFAIKYTPTSSAFVANSGTIRTSHALDFSDADGDGIYLAELRVEIVSDDVADTNENLEVIVNPDTVGSEKYFASSNDTATVFVADDDDPPAMSISVAPVTEGNDTSTNAQMVFTVEIDEQSFEEISVNYTTTTTGTATSDTDFSTNPGDFLAKSGTLTFSKRSISAEGTVTVGVTSQTFSIPIYGDVLDEDDETVIVMLSNVENATLATEETTETGTITDDDALPVISIANAMGLEGTTTDGSVSFTVSLNPVSGRQLL